MKVGVLELTGQDVFGLGAQMCKTSPLSLNKS